ncbi:hypothetical protein V2J09_023532 [Rumex salicifolius]
MRGKGATQLKRNSNKKGKRGGSEVKQDPFFQADSKRRRKGRDEEDDSEIDSGGSDLEFDDLAEEGVGGNAADEGEKEDDFRMETVDEKRLRLAKAHLAKVKYLEEKEREEDGEEESEDEEGERERDSLVKRLQKNQLEESGRARRLIAASVQIPEIKEEPRLVVKHRQSVTAVSLSSDDIRGFSASKDGTIIHWDVESGKSEKYTWPAEAVLKSHGVKDPQGKARKHCKQVLALAVSSDDRYLATGGLDRHIHLWDTRTREHILAFPGHRGPVSCLSFRQGSSELFSGSSDRSVKIWNAEDRAYITTLFGHQSEVLSINCLQKERALSAGRDGTMRLWKVPEESQLVFRASASTLDCCCFVSNDTFLSGSDDGSVELWSSMRKKPVSIIKNAHPVLATEKPLEKNDNERMPNGHVEDDNCKPDNSQSAAQSWVSSVAVCNNSDLAASGAGNGFVRLWGIENEAKSMRPLYDFPLTGFVNAMAFAKSGRFLVAGVGQELRLGRWGRVRNAENGVALHSLNLS